MAKKLFLVDIDLNGNQMKNAAVEVLSAAPESPVQGQIYFNSTDSKFYWYTGKSWASGETYSAANMASDTPNTQYGMYDSSTGNVLKFRVLKTVDDRLKLGMSAGIISMNLDLKFKSAMPDDLTVPNAIGGIAKGTKAEDLKKKTLDQVLDDILFPELQPTVTAPRATVSLKGGFSANQILEVGAAAPVKDTNVSGSFDQGKGSVAGQVDKKRAGALKPSESFVWYGSNSVKDLPAKVTLGEMRYGYHAAYEQGEELVTSKGNKASTDPNPLPAGAIDSSTVSIFGTYPYFCNGASASTSTQDGSLPSEVTPNTKLPLIKWTDSLIGAKFASEAKTETRLEFYYPKTKKVTKVEFMNTVSGKWEAFTGHTSADAGKKDIQGVQVDYMKLTTNGSLSGALQLRFTLANAE